MRCKSCDYPLWQIKDRQCPECGAAFKPSDHEFNINSVRFCCPHCDQDYYGTGERGHLVPPAFNCVKCAKHISMDEMVLLPALGVTEQQTEVGNNPWLLRGIRRGFWSAFFATVGQALITPGRLLRLTPAEGSSGAAFMFALITLFFTAFVLVIPGAVFFGLMGVFAGGGGRGGGAGPGAVPAMGAAVGVMAGMGGIALVAWIIMLLLTTLCAHGLLKITGGCAHGIGRTFQALCYASGANIVSAVPCMGGYFGWIWWLVSGCIAVKEAQKVHGGRATVAVLTFPLLTFLGLFTAYAIIIYGAFAGMNTMMATTGGGVAGIMSTSRAQSITTAITFDPPPAHVAELIMSSDISVVDLYDTSSSSAPPYMTRSMATPLGSITLNRFELAPIDMQTGYAKEAANALGPNAVAYRLGDTVFTYCGIDPTVIPAGDPAGQLWMVFADVAPGNTGPSSYAVGLADGTVTQVSAASFAGQLAQQNALRASVGLQPLPDPRTVTEQQAAKGQKPGVFKIPQGGTPAPRMQPTPSASTPADVIDVPNDPKDPSDSNADP